MIVLMNREAEWWLIRSSYELLQRHQGSYEPLVGEDPLDGVVVTVDRSFG